MDVRTRSNRTFWLLLAILVLTAALSPLLPQMEGMAALAAAQPSPIPAWQLVLAGAGITLLFYSGLGFLGLLLWRRQGLPEIWELTVTNRQRFAVPALVGAALGDGDLCGKAVQT